MGIFDNSTFGKPGSPLNTLATLTAMRGPGGQNFTAGYGDAPKESIQLPEMKSPDTGSALDMGSKRAEDAARHPSDMAKRDMMGFSPKLLDLAKAMGGGPDYDNNMALTRAGIGMATAGGQTGNFLSALTAGMGSGVDYLQQARASRAERAMKEAEFNSNQDYRRATLEQTGKYQEGMLKHGEAEVGIKRRQNQLVEQGMPAEAALKKAQAEAQIANASESRAKADYWRANAASLGGGAGGATKRQREILDKAMITARGHVSPATFATEEEYAKALTDARDKIAFDTMTTEGVPTGNLPGLVRFQPKPVDPNAQPAPPEAEKPKPKEWMDPNTTYGVTPEEDAPIPLASNGALFVPAAKLKSMAASGTLGAYDPGQVFNMGRQSINLIKNDLQQVEQIGGHQLKRSFELIDSLAPKDDVFVSPQENYDKLKGLYHDIKIKFDQDKKAAYGTGTNKAVQSKAQARLPVEARILYRITGDKDFEEWGRFDGEGRSMPKEGTSTKIKIRSADGKEELMIDATDLGDAVKEGYTEVK